jgi:uncharacterized repeat protein (TIGR03803 family)
MKKTKLCFAIVVFATLNSYAQYTKLIDFDSINNGSNPMGALISDGVYLYGMTPYGGKHNVGTIFKIKPNGTSYVKLFDFDSIHGSNPYASLVTDGTFFYGTTVDGSNPLGLGSVFKIKSDGTGFQTLKKFSTDTGGNGPAGSLIFDGTFLYGTTCCGGAYNSGVVFKIKPDGTGYTEIFDYNENCNRTEYGDLITDGNFLYGMMTCGGGTYKYGNIFKIKLDGTSCDTILIFNGANGATPSNYLIIEGNFLYGTTDSGGTNGYGTVFKIKSDGTGYTQLFNFDSIHSGNGATSLISDGTYLYGTTFEGGTNNNGTIFKIKTDGTGYSKLSDFSNSANGSWPFGNVISDGTFLYGMTYKGGKNNYGTIFKYQYCTANCCFSHYTTAYDTLQNTFTIKVDSATTAIAKSYYWNFGDGSTSTQATPTHVYTKDSTYNLCLKVKTSNGDSCSYCHIIGKDAQGNIYRTSGFTLKVIDAAPLSIEDIMSKENISIFPNPTNGVFTISLGQAEGSQMLNQVQHDVIVCNVLGEKIYQSAITNQQTQIDLSNQPNGVYFIGIQTKQDEVNKKIIISR